MVRIIEYYMKYLFVFAPKRYSFIARFEVVYRNLYRPILIVYLTTLSQYLRIWHRTQILYVNDESERMWKEVDVVYFK
jgi:hypothetical protein